MTSMPALRAAAAIVRMLLIDSLSRSPAPVNSACSDVPVEAMALTGTCSSYALRSPAKYSWTILATLPLVGLSSPSTGSIAP